MIDVHVLAEKLKVVPGVKLLKKWAGEKKPGEGMNFLRRWIPGSNIPATWSSLSAVLGMKTCIEVGIMIFESRNLFTNS